MDLNYECTGGRRCTTTLVHCQRRTDHQSRIHTSKGFGGIRTPRDVDGFETNPLSSVDPRYQKGDDQVKIVNGKYVKKRR